MLICNGGATLPMHASIFRDIPPAVRTRNSPFDLSRFFSSAFFTACDLASRLVKRSFVPFGPWLGMNWKLSGLSAWTYHDRASVYLPITSPTAMLRYLPQLERAERFDLFRKHLCNIFEGSQSQDKVEGRPTVRRPMSSHITWIICA